MRNYAPRISLPYHDVSGVVAMWADACQRVAVYEHEADEEVNTTHVHMILIECVFETAEALKRQFRKLINTTRKGNELWSWEHKKFPNPDVSFIGYMTKGEKNLRSKFLKNISPAEVEEQRALWAEKAKAIVPVVSSAEPKVPKLTKYEVVMKVKEYFDEKAQREAPKDFFGRELPWYADDESILCCIRRILIDNHQPLGLYKVMDIYDGYIMVSNKAKFVDNCLQVLEKRKPRV